MTIRIIRTDGSEEQHETTPGEAFTLIERLINAKALDTVSLRDGRVMLVDDDGYEVELVEHEPRDGFDVVVERKATRPRKPANPKATALYHAARGRDSHQIVGDVAIVIDKDFGDD